MSEREADEEIRAHFEQRAAGYDDWWLGAGSFAERERPGWAAEVDELIAVVGGLSGARVLDVACGTGFLTQHLRGDVVAIDRSAAMVEIAAARLPDARVFEADAVPLPFADGEFDLLFTSHFLHHLPPDGRVAFLGEARRVGRELVVVEGVRPPGAPGEEWLERVGGDGVTHRHYRRAYTATELAEELGGGALLHDGRWFAVVTSSGNAGRHR